MAKEPALLAAIRESRARAEKGPQSPAPTPVGPVMSATVVTPDVKQPPNNYIAQTVAECTTVAHCEDLLAHAKQHGYADDGQTVQIIRAKIEELRRGDAKPGGRR
jgi:hypothetical protein